MKEIENCPKCGSEKVKVLDNIEYALGGYYCECENCGHFQKKLYSSKESAIKSWNKKAKEKSRKVSKNIKPCPFCGGKAEITEKVLPIIVDEPVSERKFVCECKNEECWVSPVTNAFDTEEKAIKAWNKRAK